MKTAAASESSPKLWGIDHVDREYARVMGDPLRTVIEAPTKLAAEEAAARHGFNDPWAHPVTAEHVNQAQWHSFSRNGAIEVADNRHSKERSRRTIPTQKEIAGAIGVLQALSRRLDGPSAFEDRNGASRHIAGVLGPRTLVPESEPNDRSALGG